MKNNRDEYIGVMEYKNGIKVETLESQIIYNLCI